MFAGCGRIGFDNSASFRPDSRPYNDGTTRAPDLTGDGVTDLVAQHKNTAGESVVSVWNLNGTPPTYESFFARMEGSSSCTLNGPVKRLEAVGDAGSPDVVIAQRCDPDLSYRVVVRVQSGPVMEGEYFAPSTPPNEYIQLFTNQNAITAMEIADVTGDNLRDLIIGQSAEGSGGVVRVFRGVGAGFPTLELPAEITLTTDGTSTIDQLGARLVALDATGDGLLDLVVAAPGRNNNTGEVYIVAAPLPPGTSVASTVARTTVRGVAVGDSLGTALERWDADADGIAELVIGVPSADGAILIFDSPIATGIVPPAAAQRTIAGVAGDRLGDALDVSGDLDGDGRYDLLASAANTSFRGAVHGVYARANITSFSADGADFRYVGNDFGAGWGHGAIIGDVDGDQRDDFAIAAPSYASFAGYITVHLSAGGFAAQGTAREHATWIIDGVAGTELATIIGQ